MGKLLKADNESENLIELVRRRLASEWKLVATSDIDISVIPESIQTAIHRSINSKTKTYRYVLPTQLLSKLVDDQLDCRSVQAGSGLIRSFDARSICHDVIVPFDRGNNNVLGGSTEPYLNNPLRIPAILPAARSPQKNKTGFDDLMHVLDYAQSQPKHAPALVRIVLLAILERCGVISVVYSVPNRISLQRCRELIAAYLSDRTGGVRLQSVAVSLFRAIGKQFGIVSDVRSGNINAADASTGSTADLECVDEDGEIVFAVEVKDRQLELRQVQDKLPGIREDGVKELLFIVQGGVIESDVKLVAETIERQFVTGQNLYVIEWSEFLSSCLILFGENGRRVFLAGIGSELDAQKIDITHRRRWAELLESV